MPQTLIELTGESAASPLHLMPANGFPPQTYLPLLRALNAFRALSLPPRALWGDQHPPAAYRSWRVDAADLLAGIKQHDLREIVAVGHSLGGVISLLALLKAPSRFKALILLDPVFLPQAFLDFIAEAWRDGKVGSLPLVQGAQRRRRRFESRAEAFERFREKSVFADWDEAALRLYVEHGLRQRPAGAGFELVWSTDWEAHYFSTVYRDIWQDLPKLNGLTPTLVLHATHSDTIPAASCQRAKKLLPAADFQEVQGQGHLFPLAAPQETAALIRDWLRRRL